MLAAFLIGFTIAVFSIQPEAPMAEQPVAAATDSLTSPSSPPSRAPAAPSLNALQ